MYVSRLSTTKSSSTVWRILHRASTKKYHDVSGTALRFGAGGSVLDHCCSFGPLLQFHIGAVATCKGSISLWRSFTVTAFCCSFLIYKYTDKTVPCYFTKLTQVFGQKNVNNVDKNVALFALCLFSSQGIKHFGLLPETCFCFVSLHSDSKITLLLSCNWLI